MNRFYTIIVAGVLFIAFSSFLKIFQNGVTIKVDMPAVIEAGTEITVNVTINKGKVTGFARYRQDIPLGFTAMAVNSAGAVFTFQDQQVLLNWLRVPDVDEIVFSYKIVAHERLIGKIDLNTRFSYNDNNEKKYVEHQPLLLAINPSPKVNPAMRVDVLEYAKIAGIESIGTKGSRTVAMRQQPAWMEEDKIFLVTLLINRDEVQKFAKIEETIPKGYTAANIDTKGGIFTYSNQMAKFIWRDLPAEPFFTVSYKLIPEDGVTPNPALMRLSGVFSYMIDERTYTSDIIERSEILAGLNSARLNDILNGITIQSTEQQPTQLAVNPPPQPEPSKQPSTLSSSTTPEKKPSTPSTSPSRTVAGKSDDELKPEEGVYYRVQIAAGHKPVNTQRYFRGYRLEYSVMKEVHDGWFKYSVGSFKEYKDARDCRVNMSNTTKINDSFVAAYNNGKRITVQDALMALNQKWVK